MSISLKIGIAQINTTVGDLASNTKKILATAKALKQQSTDVVVFPELSLTGYPPEDLLLKEGFITQVNNALALITKATAADDMPAVIIGSPWFHEDILYNTAVLIGEGRVMALTAKHELPNDGVFDEHRYFTKGGYPTPLVFGNWRLGVMICEDMWFAGSAKNLRQHDADLLIVLNSSPYHVSKHQTRLNVAVQRTRETALPLIYVNMVGGQDELVFDGRSFVLEAQGQPVVQMPPWVESTHIIEWFKRDGYHDAVA